MTIQVKATRFAFTRSPNELSGVFLQVVSSLGSCSYDLSSREDTRKNFCDFLF